MAAPLPLPFDSGFVTVAVLGVVPDVLEDRACITCKALLLVVYVGYSTATTVVGVERAGLCVVCDSLVLQGPPEDDPEPTHPVGDWDDDAFWGF